MDTRFELGRRNRPLAFARRLVLLAFAVVWAAASGCTSVPTQRDGAPAAPAFGEHRQVVRVGGYAPVDLYTEPSIRKFTVDADPKAAWGVLGHTYDQLGIPIEYADPGSSGLGNPGFLARRIDGDRMAAFLDCGSDFAGPLANQHDITLTVVTTLAPAGPESTEVTTLVDAWCRPRAVSGNQLHCTSKGVLERRIAESVAEALRTTARN